MHDSSHEATQAQPEKQLNNYEIIDCPELARRWMLPVSWVRDQVRVRATNPIPHIKFGKYVRFRWGSPELEQWLAARTVNPKPATRRW